jgi:nicotinate phosphoribosyltransferase
MPQPEPLDTLFRLYRPSLALLNDLYQLTMAYCYWRADKHRDEAAFNLYFRAHPFGGGFTVACGLAYALEYLERFGFDPQDLDYLAGLRGNDGGPLFERGFLDLLAGLRLSCDVDAVEEGTTVFPAEPLLRVRGPVIQCQLLETPLLNLVNFQTLVATKAARIRQVTKSDPIVEFGLRRAQGIDGGVAAARAAFVGGCAATSNLLAGRLLGIPVRGTHAHSWVMFFESEREAFAEYARAMPNNCVFLVDTYNSLDGVRRAVEASRWLRRQGHEPVGIRLDSGDLAYLSIEARRILDDAGFPEAAIVASNELDERIIASLKEQGAAIDVWGVGTRLVTGHGQGALGGVYKLAAVRPADGEWQYRLKLSEQPAKTSYPGLLQVRRFRHRGEFVGDLIHDELLGLADPPTLVDPADLTRRKVMPADATHEELLVPVLRAGRRVYDPPPLVDSQRRAVEQLGAFHGGVRRFVNPHQYPVGLEPRLHELRTRLMMEARRAR